MENGKLVSQRRKASKQSTGMLTAGELMRLFLKSGLFAAAIFLVVLATAEMVSANAEDEEGVDPRIQSAEDQPSSPNPR